MIGKKEKTPQQTLMLRVNNSNIRKRREIYSKLTIMSQRRSTVFLLTLIFVDSSVFTAGLNVC